MEEKLVEIKALLESAGVDLPIIDSFMHLFESYEKGSAAKENRDDEDDDDVDEDDAAVDDVDDVDDDDADEEDAIYKLNEHITELSVALSGANETIRVLTEAMLESGLLVNEFIETNQEALHEMQRQDRMRDLIEEFRELTEKALVSDDDSPLTESVNHKTDRGSIVNTFVKELDTELTRARLVEYAEKIPKILSTDDFKILVEGYAKSLKGYADFEVDKSKEHDRGKQSQVIDSRVARYIKTAV